VHQLVKLKDLDNIKMHGTTMKKNCAISWKHNCAEYA